MVAVTRTNPNTVQSETPIKKSKSVANANGAQNEEKTSMEKQSKPKHRRKPIVNSEAYPFHHTKIHITAEEMNERSPGVILSSRRFTPTEHRRIRKNWRRFARENNIDYDRAHIYAGLHSRAADVDRDQRLEIHRFVRTHNFWPKMCRKLNDRSARQVQRVMRHIFNPAVMSEAALRPWTAEDDAQLRALHAQYGENWTRIAQIMQRVGPHCLNRFERINTHTSWGRMDNVERKKFIELITAALGEQNLFLAAKCADFDEKIDWIPISIEMKRSVYVCRLHWLAERKSILAFLDRIYSTDELRESGAKMLDNPPFRKSLDITVWKRIIQLTIAQQPNRLEDVDFEAISSELQQSGSTQGMDVPDYCLRKFRNFIKKFPVLFAKDVPFCETLNMLQYMYDMPRKLRMKTRQSFEDEIKSLHRVRTQSIVKDEM